jgi:WD40 repeat protein/tetratricopeptide (TPR) repeat protein
MTEPTRDLEQHPPVETPSLSDQTLAAESPPQDTGAVANAPRLFGDYELLEELGHGGMGIVFKARQYLGGGEPRPCRMVALKRIRAEQLATAAEVQRFRKEAEAAAHLDHAHIVPIYDVGERDGQHYFSMRLLPGGSLDRCLRGRAGADQQRQAARWVATVARAIHYAHQRGILHRDLKPGNILLDERNQPLVSDFGLAKRLQDEADPPSGESLTPAGAVLGTPSYMAPEQAAGKRWLTTAADTYSLGAILYALVTGRPPFRGETQMETLLEVLEKAPPAPRALNPLLDRDLETICLKCLEKEPGRRYGTAEALAEDLEKWLDGRPISARPVGRGERLWRWCRRNPLPAAAVALLACIVGLAFTLITLSRNEALRARDAEAEEKRRAEEAVELARDKTAEAEKSALLAAAQGRKAQKEADRARLRTYFLTVSLAHKEWLTGNVEGAERLLDKCPKALRNWEWRYLKGLCHTDLLTLQTPGIRRPGPLQPLQGALGVAFSPDGRLLASAGIGPTVVLWDASTGRKIRTLHGHKESIQGLAFSPNGKWLATGSADRTAKVWEVKSGKELVSVGGHLGAVNSVAFSRDGRQVASASGKGEKGSGAKGQGEVKIWAAATGRVLRTLGGHTGCVWCVAFSPDGRHLATAGADSKVAVWDGRTGQLKQLAPYTDLKINSLAFSPDGKLLAITAGAILKPGAELFQITWPSTVRVWHLTLAREIQVLRESGERSRGITSVAFSPCGNYLAFGGVSRKITIAHTPSWQEVRVLRGHTDWVACLAFSADGRRLVSGGLSNQVKVWDFTTGQEALTLRGHTMTWKGFGFSRDGRLLAKAAADGTIEVWDTRTARALRTFPGLPGPPSVSSAAFTADCKYAALGFKDGTVQLRDVTEGRRLRSLKGHTKDVLSLAFRPDGKHLASSSNDHTVKVWDVGTGKQLQRFRFYHKKRTLLVLRVIYHPDGRQLALACADAARVIDAATGRVRFRTSSDPGGCWSVALTRAGDRLAVGRSGTVELWDLASGRRLFSQSKSKEKFPWIVGFTADGRRLIGASGGNMHFWDTDTGYELLTLPTDSVSGFRLLFQFSPDGRWLATQGSLRTVKLYDGVFGQAEGRAVRRQAARHGGLAWHRHEARLAEVAKQWSTAGFHLHRLIKEEPGQWLLHVRRANAAAQLGVWHWVLADARAALALKRDAWDAWYWRGVAQIQLGQWSAGARDLTWFLKRYPSHPGALQFRGWARAALGEWDRAAEDLAKASRLAGASAEVWRQLALLHLQRRDLEGYRKACTGLLRHHGKTSQPTTAATLAWICALGPDAVPDLVGPSQLAQAALARAENSYRLRSLGAILYRRGQWESALHRLNRSQELQSRNTPTVWLFLAMAHHRRENAREARKWLERTGKWIEQARRNKNAGVHWDKINWEERVIIEALHREARDLIEKKAPEQPNEE